MKIKRAIIIVGILVVISVLALILTKNKSDEIIEIKREEEVTDHLEFDDEDYSINNVTQVEGNDIEDTDKQEYEEDEQYLEFDEDDYYISDKKENNDPIDIPPEQISENEKNEVVINIVTSEDNSTAIIKD